MRNATILSQIQNSMMASINASAYANARMSGMDMSMLSSKAMEATSPMYLPIVCGTSRCGRESERSDERCQRR